MDAAANTQSLASLLRRVTPPQRFLLVSLSLVAIMVAATSVTQFSFYRRQIIERESAVIFDLVNATVHEQTAEGSLVERDLAAFKTKEAQAQLMHSFGSLRNLSGVARLKVFNRDRSLVWSDEPALIGVGYTRHWEALERAFNGDVRVVFMSADESADPAEGLPHGELVEF